MARTLTPSAIVIAYTFVADWYDDFYDEPSDRAESEVMYGWAMEEWARCPRGYFIDLGCGPGSLLNYVRPERGRYLGIDITPSMVHVAREKHPEYAFLVGDETELPAQSAFVFGGFGPLMHVADLDLFSEYVRQALVPGGRFMLSCAETRITPGFDPIRRDAQTLSKAFSWADDLGVRGLRWMTPKRLSARWQTPLLRYEARFAPPDRCRFRIVTGRR